MAESPVGGGPRDTSFQPPALRQLATNLSERNFSKNTHVIDSKQVGL